ncbi:MAG: glycerol-3-phosphate dehydrogenase/oxidase [Gemmatimonadota bacterium]
MIGGGITGAGIARDAAMRGLRVVLVDQQDFAAGTSSRSSRLIHGGLRYLEEGNLRLVFEASRERRTLLRIAPHLVRPLPFIFPVHGGDRVPLWKLGAGVWLYDLLALFRNVRSHRILGKRALLQAEPMLRERGLKGGARYYDAQCDDARLVIANIRSALGHGAKAMNYTRVEALEAPGGEARGARVTDLLTGASGTIRAALVVNACGPWSDAIRRLEDPAAAPVLRLTKGAHVIVPRRRLGNNEAITLTSPLDGRVMFVLPWGELSYIGTTDTDTAETPDAVRVSEEDIHYLLRSANAYFPNAHLNEADVLASWAGLRPLLAPETEVGASHVSREHRIIRGPLGMLTIAGGKLTTYRSMAAELVDVAVRELQKSGRGGGTAREAAGTDREPLPGGEARDLEPFRQPGLDLGLPPDSVDHLLHHFGTEAAAIYNLVRQDRALLAPIVAGHPAIEAEVIHVTRRELAQHVDDVMVRRLHLYYEAPRHGVSGAAKVAALMGRELSWNEARVAEEAARYLKMVEVGESPRLDA